MKQLRALMIVILSKWNAEHWKFCGLFKREEGCFGYNHNHSDVVGTISLTYEITSHDDTLMPCLRISPNLGHDSEELSLDVLVQESPTDFTQFKNQ